MESRVRAFVSGLCIFELQRLDGLLWDHQNVRRSMFNTVSSVSQHNEVCVSGLLNLA